MGFVLQKTPTFRWPVEIQTQSDGGSYRSEKFTAVFYRLNADDHDALAADYGQLLPAILMPGMAPANELAANIKTIQTGVISVAPPKPSRTMRQLAQLILAGWDDIFQEDNTTQIPYSEEVRDQLLNTAGVCQALVSTYLSSAAKAKVGN